MSAQSVFAEEPYAALLCELDSSSSSTQAAAHNSWKSMELCK